MIEFRPLRTLKLKSGWCVEGDTSSGKSKAWFQRLVDDVLAWMGEQQLELPDSESFKAGEMGRQVLGSGSSRTSSLCGVRVS